MQQTALHPIYLICLDFYDCVPLIDAQKQVSIARKQSKSLFSQIVLLSVQQIFQLLKLLWSKP